MPLVGELGEARRLVIARGDLAVGRAQAFEDLACGRARVAENADGIGPHESQDARIRVDLDQLRVLRPVVDLVLRQGAEGSEARAEREHHVGLLDDAHRRLRTLVPERAAHERVTRGEGVVVQVARDHGGVQELGQRDRLGLTPRHDHAAAGEDHGEARLGEQVRRGLEALGSAGRALQRAGLRDLDVDVAVEVVARDVDLGRSTLIERDPKRAVGEFGDSLAATDVDLVLRDLREDRQLFGLLEATEPRAHAARFGRDRDHGRVCPVRGRDRRHEVGDAGPVLRDAHAVAVGHARVSVGHVRGILLVGDGHEADSRSRKDVEGVHVRRPDDPEDVRHVVCDQGLDERFAGGHEGHGGAPLRADSI